ncbi:hypothetical protein [Aquisphaera insulae]|uniref:hypothetical protein n=1 Tax=Aquisphaera insulae TaxID=2712864 RepID=UPI0013ECAA9D|nr:hypothetical protein [Aquisphaera insulae]
MKANVLGPAVLAQTSAGVVVVILAASVAIANADEPRKPWDSGAALTYLDGRAEWWSNWPDARRGRGTACVSCHSSMPYAIAIPAMTRLRGKAPAPEAQKRLLSGVRSRVEHWDQIVSPEKEGEDPFVPLYAGARRESALDTEAVLNALVLVVNDPRTNGKVEAPTGRALDLMWGRQQASGNWRWLEFGLRPWENEAEFFGAALAAVAAGTAGDAYPNGRRPEIEAKTTALRGFLRSRLAASPLLHHQALALWAGSHLEGTFAEDEKGRMVTALLEAQRPDGGWSAKDLGKPVSQPQSAGWEIRGAHPAGSVSDAYATGLVVLALRRSGRPVTDERLARGLAWLATNQADDGTWPVVYLNHPQDPQEDVGKFVRDAGTAYAIMALTE